MTEIRSIHPNPGGPVRAASPYDRKLAEVARQFGLLLSVAPEKDRSELLLIQGILDKLLEK